MKAGFNAQRASLRIAAMLKLAAFADEISPELDEQVRVCKANGVTHFELRTVNKINVLDFDQPMREKIKKMLADNGLAVGVIGSPIGKVKINEPWPAHFDRFKYAVDSAEFFGASMIRVFSYYPPEKDEDIHEHRDEVVRRMQAKVDYIKEHPIMLVHENEHGIYGDHGKYCLDLMKTIDSPKFRCAFDFANFVLDHENPLDNWPSLKPYTSHIHVKDATFAGKIVPAGEGDGKIAEILSDAYKGGYRGFVTMEPHLSVAGQFSGFSGPDLFSRACNALKALCRKINVPLAGA